MSVRMGSSAEISCVFAISFVQFQSPQASGVQKGGEGRYFTYSCVETVYNSRVLRHHDARGSH